MVLTDDEFNRINKLVRKKVPYAGDVYKRLGDNIKINDKTLGAEVHEWGVSGIKNDIDFGGIGKTGVVDGIKQEIKTLATRKGAHLRKNHKLLVVAVSLGGVPEWSRLNIGGHTLKELARQCNVSFKENRQRQTFSCKISAEKWYRPSNEKLFLNRHYEDMRAEYIKRQIIDQHPECTLWIPTVTQQRKAMSSLLEFMQQNNFHSHNTVILTATQSRPVGITRYTDRVDPVEQRGLAAHGKMRHVAHPKGESVSQMGDNFGEMTYLSIGIGSAIPRDPMVVMSEKERHFYQQYQFPLIHHSLFLRACGNSKNAMHAVTRDVTEAQETMETMELSHVETAMRESREREQGERKIRQRLEKDKEAEDSIRQIQQHAIRDSVVGKFLARKSATV